MTHSNQSQSLYHRITRLPASHASQVGTVSSFDHVSAELKLESERELVVLDSADTSVVSAEIARAPLSSMLLPPDEVFLWLHDDDCQCTNVIW